MGLGNGALFRWCLANGLKVVQPMTLMSLGLYNEPAGAFIPVQRMVVTRNPGTRKST